MGTVHKWQEVVAPGRWLRGRLSLPEEGRRNNNTHSAKTIPSPLLHTRRRGRTRLTIIYNIIFFILYKWECVCPAKERKEL